LLEICALFEPEEDPEKKMGKKMNSDTWEREPRGKRGEREKAKEKEKERKRKRKRKREKERERQERERERDIVDR